jgi:hypothetical protein
MLTSAFASKRSCNKNKETYSGILEDEEHSKIASVANHGMSGLQAKK